MKLIYDMLILWKTVTFFPSKKIRLVGNNSFTSLTNDIADGYFQNLINNELVPFFSDLARWIISQLSPWNLCMQIPTIHNALNESFPPLSLLKINQYLLKLIHIRVNAPMSQTTRSATKSIIFRIFNSYKLAISRR